MLDKSMVIFTALFVLIISGASLAYAAPTISLDKSSYGTGDTIKITGTLSELESGRFVLLQIKSPNDIVALDQFVPSSKSFSKTIIAEGPKWSESGTYAIVVSYLGEKTEKTFQFSKSKGTAQETKDSTDNTVQQPKENKSTKGYTTNDTEQDDSTKNTPSQDATSKQDASPESQRPKPVISIKGFPDLAKPPTYYYERYGMEPAYKQWFDSVFVGYSINDVVGYQQTHIPGFPDPAKSPQYYIDRYNTEPAYKQWFDSQFPEKTLQEIVIPSEKIQNVIPVQIKEAARMWSSGNLQDSSFISAIKQLIQNDIIQNETDIAVESSQVQPIPEWVKNNAEWWSEGLITENDFLFGLEELLRRGIIELS